MRMKECATIIKVDRIRPGRIHVRFADGTVRELDLKRYARKGTVFESLADPKYSRRFRIVDKGHALRWPGGVDFCADVLFKSGKQIEVAGKATKPVRKEVSRPIIPRISVLGDDAIEMVPAAVKSRKLKRPAATRGRGTDSQPTTRAGQHSPRRKAVTKPSNGTKNATRNGANKTAKPAAKPSLLKPERASKVPVEQKRK